MKVYMLGPTYPFRGGIAHYTTLLFRAFKKVHDITFCAVKRQYPLWLFPGKTDKDSSQDALKEDGVKYMLDSMNPFTWLQIVLDIKKQKPDVVIIPWWVSFWTIHFLFIGGCVRLFKLSKLAFICHTVVEHESNWFYRLCTKSVLRNGDYFIVHSKEDRRLLNELIPNAQVVLKAHPTYDFFSAEGYDPQESRKELGLKESDIVLLFFGFIRQYKGVPYLLDALKILKDKLPNVKLLLIGEAWHEEEDNISAKIKETQTEDFIIRHNDYIPNEKVGTYFTASDLVIFPYSSGTAGGVIQVAYAFHKPVVATSLSCFMEIVKDGETGFLVEPQSGDSIAQAVLNLVKDGDLDMSRLEQIKSQVIEHNKNFSWDSMVEAIAGGWEKLEKK